MAKTVHMTEARAAELRKQLLELVVQADDISAAALQMAAEVPGLPAMDVPGAKPRAKALSEVTARRKERAG